MINVEVEIQFRDGKLCILQIFADLLNLMLENSLSIAITLKNWGFGACPKKFFLR